MRVTKQQGGAKPSAGFMRLNFYTTKMEFPFMDNEQQDEPWERELIRDHMMMLHKEQVKDRRWRTASRMLRSAGFLIMALLMYKVSTGGLLKDTALDPHTAYINIQGEIATGNPADSDRLIPAIQLAFKHRGSQAVVLKIESPGGSPVHSGRIYEEIQTQKALYPDKKVYAVIGDIGASGGYYIAAAADDIYADQASLVGSIGVISSGFGFTGLMDKLGVERRAITAGSNKALLDPFAPLDESTRDFWESVLSKTHEQFISRVKEGRGDRLTDDPRIFSGLIWNGEQALDLGLIDGLGSINSIARDVIGQTNLVDYTPAQDIFQRLSHRSKVAVQAFIGGSSYQIR